MFRPLVPSCLRGAVLALATVVLLANSGCSVIGFTGGAMADAMSGKGNASRLEYNVQRGSRVTIWLTSGERLSGSFEGYSDESRRSFLIETRQGTTVVPA